MIKKLCFQVSFIFVFMVCGIAQNPQTAFINWKEQVAQMLRLEFSWYKENVLPLCFDHDRDIKFDVERKIQTLLNYRIDLVMDSLKMRILEENIRFDSIVMFSSYSPIMEMYRSYTTTDFYIFKGKNVFRLAMVDYQEDEIEVFSLEECQLKEIQKFMKAKEGCGYGYYIFTKFDPTFQWVIRKIIYNPDRTMK